jgi:carboxypeptidase family protein
MKVVLSRALVALALLWIAGGAAPAVAQTGINGEIVGKVTDAGGGVLPGVTITLSGPAMMGTQSVTTNESGLYRFPGVATGTYTLLFELTGFATFKREGVIVPARVTVTIDAEMAVASLAETVVVSGASPVVDLENTRLGSRLDETLLAALPTSKSLWGTATLAPGVVMGVQDPSGRNAFTKNTMIAHGAVDYSATYMGITAETAINTGSMYYLDTEAVSELSVETAAMSAEYGGTGGLNISVISKSGGNSPSGALAYGTTTSHLIGNNINPSLSAVGVNVPPLVSLYDTHVNFGGPIKKDELWYFGGYQEFRTYANAAKFPLLVEQGLRNATGRLTYQVGANGRLGGVYYYDKKMGQNNGAGPSAPDPITTTTQRSPKNLFVGNYTSILRKNVYLDASVGHFDLKNPAAYSPQWDALPLDQKLLLSSTTNSSTGVSSGPPGPQLEQDSDRFEMKGSLSFYEDGWVGGSHQLKIGADNWYGFGKNGYNTWQDYTLTVRNDANGVPQPAQFSVYNTPFRQDVKLKSFAAFVDDRITSDRLTLNLGVRYQNYAGAINAETGGGNPFYPRITTPALGDLIKWNNFLPRTGLVLKLTKDGKNVVKASYGRYVEWIYTTTLNTVNPFVTQSLATYSCVPGAATNPNAPCNYNPNPISVFTPGRNSIDPNLKDPKVDEFTVGFERELAANVGLSATFVQRWYRDNWSQVDVGIPASAYIPATFTDPGPDNLLGTADDRKVTLYNVAPAYVGKDQFVQMTVPGTALHRSLDIALAKRLANRWQVQGSFVWSRDNGLLMGRSISNPSTSSGVSGSDTRQVADPTNPNAMINSTGAQAESDQPYASKVQALYQAPWDITFGVIYQGLSGLPRDRTFRATLAQGVTTVLADPRGTYRNDFMNIMSFNLHKTFKFGRRLKASFDGEAHNLLNSAASQGGVGTLTQAFANQAALNAAMAGTTTFFGRYTTVLDPRLFKAVFKLEF